VAEARTAAAAASTIRPYLSSYDPRDQANDVDDVRMIDCYVDNDLHLFAFEASVVAAAPSHWAHFVALSAIDWQPSESNIIQ